MTEYRMQFTGPSNGFGMPIPFSPLTEHGPPFKAITVKADTLQEAAVAAKAWYEEYAKTADRDNICFVSPEDMASILLMACDDRGDTFEMGTFDYATLNNAAGFSFNFDIGGLMKMFG